MNTTTSRSGLVPTSTRNLQLIRRVKGGYGRLPARFEATPMPLSLRPFGGMFNPFARGCSVLCNHPAPTAVKDIIQQLKTSLAIEGRNVQAAKEKLESSLAHDVNVDNIPEDLFKRYTDIESRPLTPPSVTSVHTRTSAVSFMRNRRCITPELGKNEIIKRKKIILDLRRSQSQETLFYWKPSSELSQSIGTSANKTKSAGGTEAEAKPKRQKSAEQRPKSSLAAATFDTAEPDDGPMPPQTCINDRLLDDDDVRRGKKRRKIKTAQATTIFHLSKDPETQVAALGPDSLNASTRPSLIPNSVSLLPSREKRDCEPVRLKGSFLTDDAFHVLKTELDVDVIENTFGRYLNRAMREAIKYLPPKPRPRPKPKSTGQQTALARAELPFSESKMPRKFSKSATRFEFPLNLRILEKMSAVEYLSKYVWIQRQRKQLYKRIFLKYLTEPSEGEEDEPPAASVAHDAPPPQYAEYVERKIGMACLPPALADVLEFHGTETNVAGVLRLLDFDAVRDSQMDFRTWCGIVAFAERFALDDPNGTDSCDELEKADFSSMEERIGEYAIPARLNEIFEIIRRTHNIRF